MLPAAADSMLHHRALLAAAQRRRFTGSYGTPPALPQQGQAPAAPGVSSRISPGTVPMKKGMR